MSEYSMPVLSEQDKSQLIELCHEVLSAYAEHGGVGSQEHIIYKIALAALTAKPYAYADAKAIIRMTKGHSQFFTAFPEMSASKRIGLYIAPTVTVEGDE